MGWFFGAGLGWFVGGPLGAIVGAAIQSAVSGNAIKQIQGGRQQTNDETIFITNLVAIVTKIGMADGHISRQERSVIRNFFAKSLGFQGNELRFIDAVIDETDKRNPDLYQICKAFDRFASREQRLMLLDLCYNIAAADNVITKEEQEIINEVVAALEIAPDEHARIQKRFKGTSQDNHYTVLGIDPSASVSEIKKAYRQMASQYHPDRVAHLGKEFIDFAHVKFREINESYQVLRKERGF